jgi:hypothetical protein
MRKMRTDQEPQLNVLWRRKWAIELQQQPVQAAGAEGSKGGGQMTAVSR